MLTGRNHNRYCIWKANTHSKGCNWTKDFQCPARMPLPPSEITVAEVLKSAGYHTAAFGKWHLGDLKHVESGHPRWSPSHPGMHGFDVWKVTERAVPTVNPNCACFDPETCRIGKYRRSVLPACSNYYSNNVTTLPNPSPMRTLTAQGSATEPPCPVVPHSSPILGDDSHFIVSEVKAFINNSVTSSHPFFAYVPFHAPHSRYIADAAYAKKYADRGFNGKKREYYGSIEGLDASIGEILAHLDNLGIRDTTMVWFTSDNGPSAGSPGSTNGLEGKKGTLYEGGIRVPGILQWPAVVEENIVSDYMVSTNDFLPTVMDITGTQLHDSRQLDGSSILPFLLGTRTERSKPMHWAFRINGSFSGKYTAVSIQGELKLHATFKEGAVIRSSLFNLTQDEVTDISQQHRREKVSMLRDLTDWTRELAVSATQEVGCLSENDQDQQLP